MNHTIRKRMLLYVTIVSMVATMLIPVGAGAVGGDALDVPLSYLNEEYTLKGDAAQGAIPVPDVFLNTASATVTLDQNTRVTGWAGDAAWKEEDRKGKDDAAFHFSLAQEASGAGDLAATIFDLGNNDDTRKNIIGKTLLISMDVATSNVDEKIATKGISAGVFYDSQGSATWPMLLNFDPSGVFAFDTYKTTTAYEANKWYNMTFEIMQDSDKYKAWIDGVPVERADGSTELSLAKKTGQTTVTGFRVLRGLIKTVSGQKGDLYIDNVYVSAGETYTPERYKANSDAASLSFYKDMALLNTDINAVTGDLTLPQRGDQGSTITWESSDNTVIDENGTVYRGPMGDKEATLTATIKNGACVNTKTFDLTVAQKTEDLPLLEEALNAITFDTIKNNNTAQDRVISALNLPDSGANGATVEWISSDESVITTTGEVTRYAETNKKVRLTAMVTVDDNTGTKGLDLVVPGDYVINDPCQNFDYVSDQSANIAAVMEPEFGFYGFRVNNAAPLEGQYITYRVNPGECFKVSAMMKGEPQDLTFQTADADGTYINFTDVTRSEPIASMASGKDWYQYDYVSNQPIAEGQVMLRVNMGTPLSNTTSYITGVKCYPEGEMTIDDIKGTNDSADEILTDLNLSVPGVTFLSSNENVLLNDGTVLRPDEDTMVQLIAEIESAGVQTRKIYTLNIKNKDYVNPADDLGDRDGFDAEFTDDFADFSNLYDSAPQNPGGYAFGIRPWTDTSLGLTHAVSQNHVGKDGWMTYKTEGDITGFKLDGYFSKRNGVFAEDMIFEISPDGSNWTRLSYENGEVVASPKELKVGGWYTASFSSFSIPAGTRYLKVIFGDNTTHGLRYAVLLEKIMLYSEDDITRAAKSLDAANYCHGEPADAIVSDIDLPTAYDYGTTVRWTVTKAKESDPDILSETGEIYQDNFIDYSYPVTLTAEISKRGFTKAKKTFPLVIRKDTRNFKNIDYVMYDLSKVVFEDFCDQPKEHIVDGIQLPESPEGGSTFSWSATSPVAKINAGFVTFTPDNGSTTPMNLVLTASYNGTTATKEFPITVIRGFSENKLLKKDMIEASSGTEVNPVLNRSFKSYWTSGEGDTSPIINVTFKEPLIVNGGLVVERGNNLSGFKLEASMDGTNWQTLYNGTSSQLGDMKRELFLFEETEAKYFRYTFYKSADALASLYTLELYNDIFSAEQAVEDALRKLSVPRSTKVDLNLPVSAAGNVSISWHSSNPNVIADDGTITKSSGKNRSAILTATASCENISKSRTFEPTTVINDINIGGGGSSGGGGGGGSTGGISITPMPPVTAPTNAPVVFGDVTTGHWAYDYIFGLQKRGVVSAAEQFRPEDSVTREEFLKMLLLGANIEIVEEGADFDDVAPDAWYADYIATANKMGIVYGMGDGNFGVGYAVSREDIAVMAARVLELQGKLTEEGTVLSFNDSDLISDYAKTAVEKLTQMQILNGNEDNTFAPAANATRAEAAKIICVMSEILSQQ